ncbi:MAG: hypothetical protein RR614_15030, partial [Eubacterium sp.]
TDKFVITLHDSKETGTAKDITVGASDVEIQPNTAYNVSLKYKNGILVGETTIGKPLAIELQTSAVKKVANP